jgi:hypothetical protein
MQFLTATQLVGIRPSSLGFRSSFLKKTIIGHQSVKADWMRFNATNPVNRNQYRL